MRDRRAFNNLIAIIINYSVYNFYVIVLFFKIWNFALARAVFYLTTALIMLYFAFEDYAGYTTIPQKHTSLIYKLSLVITFLFFTFILNGNINYPKLYLLIYNTTIILVSLAILIHGTTFGYFKD